MCQSNGKYGTCTTATTCATGYFLENNQCVANNCEIGTTVQCSPEETASIHAIHAQKQCTNVSGTYGTCLPRDSESCADGYYFLNGECKENKCPSGEEQNCVPPNSNITRITKTCINRDTGYGPCEVKECKPPTTIQRDTANLNVPNCLPCPTGTFYENGVCRPNVCNTGQKYSCTPEEAANISALTANKECVDVQGTYERCVATSCDSATLALRDGRCVPHDCIGTQTKMCDPEEYYASHVRENQGIKTCNSVSGTYGTCLPRDSGSCADGYYFLNGECKEDKCPAGVTKACSTGGSVRAEQTCITRDTGYGACVIQECPPGKHPLNAVEARCVDCIDGTEHSSCPELNDPTSRIQEGYQRCNLATHTFEGCIATACKTGFVVTSDGRCVKDTCSSSSDMDCIQGLGGIAVPTQIIAPTISGLYESQPQTQTPVGSDGIATGCVLM